MIDTKEKMLVTYKRIAENIPYNRSECDLL